MVVQFRIVQTSINRMRVKKKYFLFGWCNFKSQYINDEYLIWENDIERTIKAIKKDIEEQVEHYKSFPKVIEEFKYVL